jgi:hypothetical protein
MPFEGRIEAEDDSCQSPKCDDDPAGVTVGKPPRAAFLPRDFYSGTIIGLSPGCCDWLSHHEYHCSDDG